MKNLKKFIILFVSGFFLQFYSFACGWYPMSESYRFSVYSPKLGNDQYLPFSFTNYYLYDYEGLKSETIANDQNIKEWLVFLNKKAEYKDIDAILNETQPILFIKEISKPNYLKKNTFFQLLRQHQNKEIHDYLVFAKKVEEALGARGGWNSNNYDTFSMRKLIIEAEILYKSNKSPFLKLRLGYLMVKMSKYIVIDSPEIEKKGHSLMTLRLYEKYVFPHNSNSITKYWAMYHYATAQNLGLKNIGFANYLFTKAFDKAVNKRIGVYNAYEVNHLNSTLKYARNNHEKAVIYVVNELKNPGPSLASLKQIYALEPTSQAIESLLIREINKLEDWILTIRYTEMGSSIRNMDYWVNGTSDYSKAYKKDMIYLNNVRSFVDNCLSKKVRNRALWNLSAAYLAYMDNDFEDASVFLNNAQNSEGMNQRIETQIHLIRIMAELRPEVPKDSTQEAFLIRELTWLEKNKHKIYKFDQTYGHLMLALTNRYEEAGNKVMAALCHSKNKFNVVRFNHNRNSNKATYSNLNEFNYYSSYFFYLDENANISDVKGIIDLIKKPNKTPLEVYLTKECSNDYWRLVDLLATKYFRNNQLYAAKAVYRQVPSKFYYSKSESFQEYLNNDIYQGGFYQQDQTNYSDESQRKNKKLITKLQIINKLITKLESANRVSNKNRAKDYFYVANAYFNFSYYGNSWLMTNYWHSIHDLSNKKHLKNTNEQQNYFGCKLAKKYYLEAFKTSKNKEFKALCLKMAAVCEGLSIDYKGNVLYGNDYDSEMKIKFKNKYYAQLKSLYPDIYPKLMNSCTYYSEILNKI